MGARDWRIEYVRCMMTLWVAELEMVVVLVQLKNLVKRYTVSNGELSVFFEVLLLLCLCDSSKVENEFSSQDDVG